MKIRTFCLPALAGIFLVNSVTHAATVKATYQFDNTLAANESGVAALNAVNPLNTNAYLTDSVFGNNRTVYAFNGNTASAQQAGLSFTNGSELISPNSYSLHLVFQFSSASTFKRIIDVQNRNSDNGVYADSGRLRLYATATGAQTSITPNVYSNVIITNDGSRVAGYLNGVQQFNVADSQLNLNNSNNPNQVINLFLDNTANGFQGEYSSGRIALFQLFDGVVTASEAADLAANPFTGGNDPGTPPPGSPVPEPASCSLLAGAALLGYYRFACFRKPNR